jgi:hypothetical protein
MDSVSSEYIYIGWPVSNMLDGLQDQFGHTNEGQTITLALICYEWLWEMRAGRREVGGLNENERTFRQFDRDYRSQSLYSPGSVQVELVMSRQPEDDLDRIIRTTEAVDLSTLVSEAIIFLEDIVSELKKGKIIVAIDFSANSFLQLKRTEFERI